ncbi:apolipoprotein D and lipocalin family protein [Alteromonadaceae bacterium Bs31]|nr:apolipoprotein D and lipocalin family protein [Alteromonadaceae bacterium Bs31]
MKIVYLLALSLCLSSCAAPPENIKPVSGFELEKYAGKWYEIARLDHRFERGLEQVTASYSIEKDGTVKVVNRGLSSSNNEWKDAIGKAKLAGDANTGYLKVSFFGPFYGPYIIFELDKENYQYSFVSSGEDYLWFLSRTPTVSDELKNKFIETARELDFATEDLIFVKQQ